MCLSLRWGSRKARNGVSASGTVYWGAVQSLRHPLGTPFLAEGGLKQHHLFPTRWGSDLLGVRGC